MDLDLFCGARGWEAAADGLGIDALGIDNNPYACATSRAAGFATLEADVAALDPNDYRGIRGLIASPPCQTFSQQGYGTGRQALDVVLHAVQRIAAGTWPTDLLASTGDVRTSLVLQPLRFALATRPQWIAWEQVPPVLPVWRACAGVLRQHGYHAVTSFLHAEQYGVPQTRRRAFLLAHRDHPIALPAPTHSRYHIRNPTRLDVGVDRWVTMAEALGWSEDPSWHIRLGARTKATVREHDQPAPTIVGGHDFNKCHWVLRNNNQAKACVRPLDAPAGSLFFGARVNTVAWHGPDGTRNVTLDEIATLQTFPPGYPFQGGKSACFQQIGNAVPPRLARAVLAALTASETPWTRTGYPSSKPLTSSTAPAS